MRRGRATSTDQLIDAIWFDQVPPSARQSLQNQIGRLRRRFGPGLITSDLGGYHLWATMDVEPFVDTLSAILARRPDPADVASLDAAMARWQGIPYTDLCDHATAEAERARLVELHAQGAERLAECRLLAGTVGQAIVELNALIEDDPFREPRWRLLMAALHRDGRRTEALATYQRAVDLAESLGAGPSEALMALRSVVEQDRRTVRGREARVPDGHPPCTLDRRRQCSTRHCAPSVARSFRVRATG